MPIFHNTANPTLRFGSQGFAFHNGLFETDDKAAIELLKKTEDYRNGHVAEVKKDAKPKDQAATVPNTDANANVPANVPEQPLSPIDAITVKEITAELDSIGVAYDKNAKKPELFEILTSVREAIAAQNSEGEGNEGTGETAPTEGEAAQGETAPAVQTEG